MLPFVLVIAAILALGVGPALSEMAGLRSQARVLVDGLGLTLVVGLCLLHMVPHALEHGGLFAELGLAGGIVLPILGSRGSGKTKSWRWGLGLLALHAALDGSALALVGSEAHGALGLAVIAHRLPIGFFVFAAAVEAVPDRSGWRAIAVLAAATLVGFVLGVPVDLPWKASAFLEGLVSGWLLHICLQPGPSTASEERATRHSIRGGAIGALVGLIALLGFGWLSARQPGLQHVAETSGIFLALALTCAPALLVGILLAGTLHALVPTPLARRLHLDDANAPLSPESLALTVPLLGVPLTLVRLLGAAFLALLSWGFPTATSPADSTSPDPVETPHPFSVRLRGGLHQALTRRFDRVLPWFLLGLVVAALAQVLLGPEPLRSLPTALQVPLLALLGLSVCASPTSATLLATVALHKGSTPGAALVFLWAGASWRWPSSRTPPIPKKHRHQARGALVFGVAMVLGWTLDALPVTTGPLPEAWQTMTPTPVTVGALGFLGLMALSSLFRQGPRGLLRPMFSPRVPPVQGPVSGSSPLS